MLTRDRWESEFYVAMEKLRAKAGDITTGPASNIDEALKGMLYLVEGAYSGLRWQETYPKLDKFTADACHIAARVALSVDSWQGILETATGYGSPEGTKTSDYNSGCVGKYDYFRDTLMPLVLCRYKVLRMMSLREKDVPEHEPFRDSLVDFVNYAMFAGASYMATLATRG